jgi:cell division protein ZapA
VTVKSPNNVTVRILEHEYQVQCPENERESLLAAAEYLNQRMTAIRKKGKALGMERIAIMTALNMAAELLDNKRSGGKVRTLDSAVGERLNQLQLRIDGALNENR